MTATEGTGLKERLIKRKITRNAEIQTLFENGKRIRGNYFDILFLKNNLSYGRAGIIVGKKIGGAVERNHIKRIFREILFNQKIQMNFPADFLVIPKNQSKKALFQVLKEEVILFIQKMASQLKSPEKKYP